MAIYNEEAKLVANIIKDKNQMKASIAGSTEVIHVTKRTNENFAMQDVKFVAKTREITAGFYLDSAIWGLLGTSSMAGAGTFTVVEVGRNLWEWRSDDLQLTDGTSTDNINLTNNDIRLG